MERQLATKKIEIESKAMKLKGVTGIALGQNHQGDEVIQILLHIPVADFKQPDFLKDPDIELFYIGSISSE